MLRFHAYRLRQKIKKKHIMRIEIYNVWGMYMCVHACVRTYIYVRMIRRAKAIIRAR